MTLYILYMLILMQWQEEQEIIFQRSRHGAMLFICLVQQRLTLHQSFQKKHRISYICVSLTIQQVQQLLRMSFRSGLITLIRLALLLSMMQHMKHTFQNQMFLILYMSVKVQEHVQSNSGHSLRMQDLQV